MLEDISDLSGHKTPHGKVWQVIPAEAVEAAVEALRTPTPPYKSEGVLTWEQIALTVLEAAAPYMLNNEGEK